MSDVVGNNLLLQYCFSPSRLEHKKRINSSISIWRSTFYQPQASSLTHQSPLSTEFHGKRLTVKKKILRMGKQHAVTRLPHAVLATEPSPQLVEKFNLDGNVELQVEVIYPPPGSVAVVTETPQESAEEIETDARYKYPTMSKTHGNFQLKVMEGEFTDSQVIVMLGENGTGKTTFKNRIPCKFRSIEFKG